jgi:diguanylate cyclase (GGDEF)-like protein
VLYPILALISLLPILVSFFTILIHRKRLTKKYARMLLIVPLLIVAAAVLQIIFYGLSLIWSSISLALLFAYMRIQSDQVYLDHLTGVFNRRQMDIYLADRIRMAQAGRNFSCILLDIDHFKTVNDKLGHVAGDEALKDASNILKSSIRKGDFLARYGGDEFFIVTDIDDEQSLRSLINRINENSNEFNQSMQRPYLISFSAGETIYDPKRKWTRDQLISFVDELMYQNKYESVHSKTKSLEQA